MDESAVRQALQLRSMGFSGSAIARMLNVSRSSLRWHLGRMAIRTATSDAELDEVVFLLLRQNRHCGAGLLWARLRLRGIFVSRQRLRDSMRRVDEAGAAVRRRRSLRRRVYFVQHVNFLWHMDGWHKLIRWRLVVHGGLDGHTRLCVFLVASSDNSAKTAFAAFLQGVMQFGAPRHIRVDGGGENVLTKRYVTLLRGEGAALVGPSVHNQRIERFWRDLFRQIGHIFYQALWTMELLGLVDVSSANDLAILHAYIKPLLNSALREFQTVWNRHGIRTERYRTPTQLAVLSCHVHPTVLGVSDCDVQRTAARWLLEADRLRERVPRVVPEWFNISSEQIVSNYVAFRNSWNALHQR